MAGEENVVEMAIMMALQEYCRGRNLQQFRPVPRQQGEALRQYCGDLFGLMDDADLIALEIKELDVASGRLKAFNTDQHEAAKRFESLKVPLAYAYNSVSVNELAYHQYPQPACWGATTLAAIKRSTPTPLPGPTPDLLQHETLLDWLNGKHGTDGSTLFGRLHGKIKSTRQLRNGVLVLLYSVEQSTLATMTEQDVVNVLNQLNQTQLGPRQQAKLEKILVESAKVFNAFQSPQPPTLPGQSGSGPSNTPRPPDFRR
ncbi:Uncharacterised protein [Comamonas aquatica]|uniref:hypothetical protein n=1 Tax=Comamonas aquatica TaxID=225991 RepID=UPI001EF25783|nr:hypothetical protein [Comamonas aquatica]CAB5681841.1 Uncharacterised protein [Comamonas aquatica]CAC9217320.1 Uncharacterised protein [Comamonas aquatica]